MKKLFKIFTLVVMSVFVATGVMAIGGGGGMDPTMWKKVGGVLQPSTPNQAVEIYELEITNAFTLSGAISGAFDLNGEKMDLDADGDTSITADTDDQIDIEINNADDFQFTANTFTLLTGSSIDANTNLITNIGNAGTDFTATGGLTLADVLALGANNLTSTGTLSGTQLDLGVATSTLGVFTLSGNTSGTVTINTAAAAGTYSLILPIDDGDANEFLQTNGSGVLDWAAVSSAISPSVLMSIPYVEVGADTGQKSQVISEVNTNAQTLIYAFQSAVSNIQITEVDRIGNLFSDWQQEDDTITIAETSTTQKGSFCVIDGPGATAGEYLFMAGHDTAGNPDTFEIWSVPVASLGDNFTKVTVGGANKPPNLDIGVYQIMAVSDTKIIIWHDNDFYFGDITNATTIDFDDASVAVTLVAGNTDISLSKTGSDGTEVLIGVPEDGAVSDPLWDLQILSTAGVSSKLMSNVYLPLNGKSGRNFPVGFLKINDEWCVVMSNNLGSGNWIISIDTDNQIDDTP